MGSRSSGGLGANVKMGWREGLRERLLPPLPGRFCLGMLDRRLTPPANFR